VQRHLWLHDGQHLPVVVHVLARYPLRDEVLELIEGEKPSLLQRKKLGDRIIKRIMDYVETFIKAMSTDATNI